MCSAEVDAALAATQPEAINEATEPEDTGAMELEDSGGAAEGGNGGDAKMEGGDAGGGDGEVRLAACCLPTPCPQRPLTPCPAALSFCLRESRSLRRRR